MNKFGCLFALIAPLSALGLSGTCLGQNNLLKDSGFESGLGAWQVSGGKFYAGFETLDCDGDGAKSQCLSVSPDSTSNPFFLTQKVAITKGRAYWIRATVLATGSLTASNWSEVAVGIGGQANYFNQTLAYRNPHKSGNSYLLEIACPFTPGTDYAWLSFRFQTYTRAGLGFKVHIDNIEMYEMSDIPWSECTTMRNLTPKSLGIRTYGQVGSFYMIWLGTKQLPTAVKLAGISGLLEMDPTGGMIMVATGVVKSNGADDISLPISPAIYSMIKEQPLLWMPVQVTSLPTTVAIGKVARWGFQ